MIKSVKRLLSVVFMIVVLFARAGNAAEYIFAPNLLPEQIQLVQETKLNWVRDDMTAAQGFVAIQKLIDADPIVRSFFQHITSTLKARGIHQLEDVVRICPPDDSAADGYAMMPFEIVEVRPRLPGHPEISWSTKALQAIENAYASRILQVPFLDYLVVLEKTPTVCVKANQDIRTAYGIFVHEFIHFFFKNPFEQVIPNLSFDILSYVHSTVTESGGEFDAFKMQVGAEVRLLGKMGILNPNANHSYANIDGSLRDEEALRQQTLQNYIPYYHSSSMRSRLVNRSYQSHLFRSQFLKFRVLPLLTGANDAQLMTAVQLEISQIEEAIKKLQTQYPEDFNK